MTQTVKVDVCAAVDRDQGFTLEAMIRNVTFHSGYRQSTRWLSQGPSVVKDVFDRGRHFIDGNQYHLVEEFSTNFKG